MSDGTVLCCIHKSIHSFEAASEIARISQAYFFFYYAHLVPLMIMAPSTKVGRRIRVERGTLNATQRNLIDLYRLLTIKQVKIVRYS